MMLYRMMDHRSGLLLVLVCWMSSIDVIAHTSGPKWNLGGTDEDVPHLVEDDPMPLSSMVPEVDLIYSSGYFQGDMMMTEAEIAAGYGAEVAAQAKRDGETLDDNDDDARSLGAVRTGRRKWPDNTIYYQFDAGYPESRKTTIRRALRDYEALTNVVAVEGTGSGNYALIRDGSGCSSQVGMIRGAQRMSLAAGCMSKGTILHEFMHALGFSHEHTAPDRDNFVTVYLENVQSGREHNFNKITRGLEVSNSYDYASVMHYSEYAFSISRSTLKTIDCRGNTCGQRGGFSAKDRDDINRLYPTPAPTRIPTRNPTRFPTRNPTRLPTRNPTGFPTQYPTSFPTPSPTRQPTSNPTRLPTRNPTNVPTRTPTVFPTPDPTDVPTSNPTRFPTRNPTDVPTRNPTSFPTNEPTEVPTRNPTHMPTNQPTHLPTHNPTRLPTRNPTDMPTRNPTGFPTPNPTDLPTRNPTNLPSNNPTLFPTRNPTDVPTRNPTQVPTASPNLLPTRSPSRIPTGNPTAYPAPNPTDFPTRDPTPFPTRDPTEIPTRNPTRLPTRGPTGNPTRNPTEFPTGSPSRLPTPNPTRDPTRFPGAKPSQSPSYGTSNPVTQPPSLSPVTASPSPPFPKDWTCVSSGYDLSDGCHCDCGVVDPDCAKPRRDANAQLFCGDLLADASKLVCNATNACALIVENETIDDGLGNLVLLATGGVLAVSALTIAVVVVRGRRYRSKSSKRRAKAIKGQAARTVNPMATLNPLAESYGPFGHQDNRSDALRKPPMPNIHQAEQGMATWYSNEY